MKGIIGTENFGILPLLDKVEKKGEHNMDLLEAIEKRHSVRSYLDKKIEGEVLICLKEQIAACNKESGLRFQLVIDEPEAFSGMMARYGKFHNVKNYIALIGEKSENLEENIGYYGEKIAIFAAAARALTLVGWQ